MSLLMYIKGRLANRQAIKLGSISLSLLFAVLALKTKEIAFTLPVMVVIYEFVYFRSSLKKRLLFFIPIVLMAVIGLITVFSSGKPFEKMISDLDEITRVQTQMSRFYYLITQIRVVTTYIRLLFLPIHQNFDYDYPIYHSLFELPVLLSFVFLVALIGTGVYLLYRSGQAGKPESRQAAEHKGGDGFHYSLFATQNFRFIAFGIFWFFVTLSIESSVIPIIDVIFEHRVYLPSIGLFMSITGGIYLSAHKLRLEKVTIYALVLIVLIFSGLTYARNAVWKSKITLWEDVTRKSPYKARPHNNLGMFYSEAGREDKALAEFETAVKLDPDYTEAHYNLGSTYSGYGRLDEALREFQMTVKLKPDYADAHNNLGVVYAKLGRVDEAIREFQTAVRLKSDHADAHSNLGIAYAEQGRLDDALREYQTALKLKPDHVSARNNLEMLNKKIAGEKR
jgi:Flp pilus assembly protein TadD